MAMTGQFGFLIIMFPRGIFFGTAS
jgi:hypothetical protein